MSEKKDKPHESLFWRRENYIILKKIREKILTYQIACHKRKKSLIDDLKKWEQQMHQPIWINGPYWQKHDWKLYGTYGHVALPDSIK